MDIGDPSEIPATRRRLPSMQELGAFDFGAPAEAATATDTRPAALPDRAPVAAETLTVRAGSDGTAKSPARPQAATDPSAAAPDTPAAPPAAAAATPRPALTAEQLRQALAKADPGTRQKLLRLIAGGRTVQQMASGAATDLARRRSLVMQLDPPSPAPSPSPAAPAPAPAASLRPEGGAAASGFGAFSPLRGSARGTGASQPGPTAAPRAASPRPTSRAGRPGEQPLMQIDAHTELLDAAPPPVSPAARKAELQAQLDQVPRQAMGAEPARSEPLAHKVLFPAYDPARHGDDVRSQARRRHEGPIEGHYPAPRQPFKPSYQHPDGRPMTAEESQVEEVLQTQRCEETLGVLARDGVNGLLLSPRDLDAAVSNGVISAEAAATLWKTWAALRPVIHVIEDDPPAPPASEATDDEEPVPSVPALAVDSEAPLGVEPATASEASVTPAAAPGTLPPLATPSALPSPPTAEAQAAEPVTLPLPGRPWRADPPAAVDDMAAVIAEPAPAAARWPRLKARLKTLAWWFVAYCVLVTSSRLAMDAWLRWGHWLNGWPGP